MPGRVQRAPHLGNVILDAPRTDIDEPRNARELLEAWRTAARQKRTAAGDAGVSLAPDGAGQPVVLTDFQSDWANFALTATRAGLDP